MLNPGLLVPIRSHMVNVIPSMCGEIYCLLIFANNMHVKVFSTFKAKDVLLGIPII